MKICFSFTLLVTLLCAAQTIHAQSTEASRTEATKTEATRIGGYGEISYTEPDGPIHGTLDIPRFVIFLSHQFSEQWSVKSEVEIEHVKVEPGAPSGEVAVEQVFVDYHHSNAFGMRGGLLLIPCGIINQTHEPTTFMSVARPHIDQEVIPSTWREIGLGIYGDLGELVKYQANITEGMNAAGFASTGIYEGRQEGVRSDPNSPGLSAKLDFLPVLGLRIGASIYYQTNTASSLIDSTNQAITISSPLTVVAFDARYDLGNAHFRAEYALDNIGNASDLSLVRGTTIPQSVSGEYIEGSYNLMPHLWESSDVELLPFVRYEMVSRKWSDLAVLKDQTWLIAGVAVKPIDGLIVKLDYEWSKEPIVFTGGGRTGSAKGLLGFGLGYAF